MLLALGTVGTAGEGLELFELVKIRGGADPPEERLLVAFEDVKIL